MTQPVTKPAIHFYTNKRSEFAVEQVLYGIEEEGIPFELKEMNSDDVIQEAYQASISSPLLVGIALKNDHIVVHYRNLPPESPLFSEQRISAKEKEYLRKMGSNAARLVKGIPFK